MTIRDDFFQFAEPSCGLSNVMSQRSDLRFPGVQPVGILLVAIGRLPRDLDAFYPLIN